MSWSTVTTKSPCPVCRKPDWCGMSADGRACICMRIESGRRTRNGGWLHWLHEPVPEYKLPPKVEKPSMPPGYFLQMWVEWIERTRVEWIQDHAAALGVSARALMSLGCAWAGQHRAWAFPMWKGEEVCGIRLRAPSGRKWAVLGSKSGVFTVADPSGDTLIICEGPTDTAAALTLGYCAIGRPSCRGQEEMIRSYIQPHKFRRVVIVADRDEAKFREDGTKWFPGQDGAVELGQKLKMPCRIVKPLAKDFRAWVNEGATAVHVECVIGNAAWVGLQ